MFGLTFLIRTILSLAAFPVCLATSIAVAGEGGPARVHYNLQGLKPQGISQYAVASRSAIREYIHFKNEQGNHYLIYEEAQGSPPNPSLKHFREVMGQWDMSCRLDLECKTAAFCTGACQNFYYESSNTPEDLGLLDRNHCELLTYHCEKPKPAAPAALSRR